MNHSDYKNVKVTGGFLHKKQELNRNITFDSVYNRFYESGRIDALRCDWKEGMGNKPHIFWDSDIAKWLEGASYSIYHYPDKELEEKIDAAVDAIEKNQYENGYFNSYFITCEPDQIFTKRTNHELYNAGHLIEAAIAYYEATGKDKFLKSMMKYADYIEKVFMKEDSAEFRTPGHEEIELALFKLYKCTGKERYLKLSEFFINERGNNSKDTEESLYPGRLWSYDQSHRPVREQKKAFGHAVRGGYLYCAMADLADELCDEELKKACEAIFSDITERKMYITGGIGSTVRGEAFTVPYDLPNANAYCETCAAISLFLFAHKMLKLNNNSVYSDIMEKCLYNGIISGLSLDGKSFFYENPLEINLDAQNRDTSLKEQERFPITERVELFGCSCCPPNINRLLSSIGGYIYGEQDNRVYINLFADSEYRDGEKYIKQTTSYPYDGIVEIETEGFDGVYIRIPSWCDNFSINCDYEIINGYAYATNSSIEVNFEMKPVLIESSEKVWENAGKAAVMMGPVVYCAEAIDNGPNLWSLYVSRKMNPEISFSEYYCGNVICADGYTKKSDTLYSRLSDSYEPVKIKLIPYAAFANRGETNMLVWLNYR